MSPSRPALAALLWFAALAVLTANPLITPREENRPDSVRPPAFGAPEKIIDAQLRFREYIADHLSAWKEKKSAGTIIALAAAGFLYGVFHALGPGHRKTVIFSLFMARKARVFEPFLAGFLSALLHAMSALVVILAFRSLSNRLFLERVSVTSLYLEGFTYLLLALLAAVLFAAELLSHRRGHGNRSRERGLYATIGAVSFFPCPAAVMILIFSLTQDLFFLGVIAVIALSAGMGITISLIGLLAWGGRETLFFGLAGREKLIRAVSSVLEGLAYLFLILFSLWMALPFLASLPGLV